MSLKLNGQIAIAVAITAVATLWIMSGQIGGAAPGDTSTSDGKPTGAAATPPVSVRVVQMVSTTHAIIQTVAGRTEARRRAETPCRVAELLVRRVDSVEKGAVIARLATDDRKARLAEAEALLRQRQIEHAAAAYLARKGYRAETGIAASQAQLDGARAAIEQARLDIARAEIRAPFA
ncbi:MAG: hypothetical protein EXQ97_05495 [Alphaproteobacteria bacterium]|nr:hypothetical protein [Alphaproteobacteria bacterium]